MKQAKKTSSGRTTVLNEINVEMWLMTNHNLTLSYQARREVLVYLVPRYRTASPTRTHCITGNVTHGCVFGRHLPARG
jgi:hypothetical protein